MQTQSTSRRLAPSLVAALCIGTPTLARAEPWTGADKAAHLGVSAALGAGSYTLLWAFGDDPPALRLALGAGIAFLPGVAKEIYDGGRPRNRFSGADLFWDGVGALVGSAAAFGLDLLLDRQGAHRTTVLAFGGCGAHLVSTW